MKEIPLTQGKIALVDDIDYENVNRHRWCACRQKNGNWYAKRRKGLRQEWMHRFLLNLQDGVIIDHRNGDGLDNRRENLRHADASKNAANSRKPNGCSSAYKGVCWVKRSRKWVARISGKHIGYFHTEEDAAKAYDVKARDLFGEFAKTNFQVEGVGRPVGEPADAA